MNILLQNQRLSSEISKLDKKINILNLRINTLAGTNDCLEYQVAVLKERDDINKSEIKILVSGKKEY